MYEIASCILVGNALLFWNVLFINFFILLYLVTPQQQQQQHHHLSKMEDVKPDPVVMKQIQQAAQQQQQHPVSNGGDSGGPDQQQLQQQQHMGNTGSDLKTQILNMEASSNNHMKYSGHPAVVPQAQVAVPQQQQNGQQPPPGSTTNLGDLNNLLHEGSSMIY